MLCGCCQRASVWLSGSPGITLEISWRRGLACHAPMLGNIFKCCKRADEWRVSSVVLRSVQA